MNIGRELETILVVPESAPNISAPEPESAPVSAPASTPEPAREPVPA